MTSSATSPTTPPTTPPATPPTSPDGDAVLERIRERRGHVWPLHHVMAELDPGFLDLFDEIYCQTLAVAPEPEPGSLPVVYRELICACACAMMPVPAEVTAHHLRRAFEHGLTERAAMEGFAALLIPAGGIAVSNGVRALMLLREEGITTSSPVVPGD